MDWIKIMKDEQQRSQKRMMKHGLLKRHLIIEAGSKFRNKLKLIKGEDPTENYINLTKTINVLKYSLPEHGEVALIKKDNDSIYIGQIIKADDFQTGTLQYLLVRTQKISHKGIDYHIEEEFTVDPRTPEKRRYVMRTRVFDVSLDNFIGIDKFNKILGREFFRTWKKVETPYIPATVFKNSFDGESDIEGLDELFELERQLLKEIVRDINLSRKKILYKTRLARKGKRELEIEMNEDSIVVFEDGNAIFTSPIDLWSPPLIIETITKTIDWLTNYVLKMKFAAKDTMSTGAQKTDEQVSEINQSAQNFLEDKVEMWSISMNEFLNLGKERKDWDTIVEFQLMSTINRLVKGNGNDNTKEQKGENN